MTKRKKTTRKKRRKSLTTRFQTWARSLWRRYRWKCLAAVVVLCLAMVPVVRLLSEFTRPERSVVDSTDYNGIDVSKYQGTIDWQRVAEDRKVQFVYIKATEGATKTDSRYAENLRKARAAGLKVGSYHFFVSFRTAEQQFENFRRHVPRDKQDLIPVVDVEEAGNRTAQRDKLQRELQRFMDLMRKEYGHYPILYSQHDFYNKMLAPEFNRYHILIARYGRRTPQLRNGCKYSIWQFSEQGHISGIRGPVDLDRFAPNIDLSTLEL